VTSAQPARIKRLKPPYRKAMGRRQSNDWVW
jgi:hypothetical protein